MIEHNYLINQELLNSIRRSKTNGTTMQAFQVAVEKSIRWQCKGQLVAYTNVQVRDANKVIAENWNEN